MKETTNTRIDCELKFLAKKIGINFSKLLEDAIRTRVQIEFDKDLNVIKMEEDLQNLLKKKDEILQKEIKLVNKIDIAKKKQEEEYDDDLKQKVDMVKALKRSGAWAEMSK